jgi:hypothetical protein
MNKTQYEQEVLKKQEEHLKKIKQGYYYQNVQGFPIEEPHCLHDACEECHGTGKKKDGSACFHYISCPCPKCTPTY